MCTTTISKDDNIFVFDITLLRSFKKKQMFLSFPCSSPDSKTLKKKDSVTDKQNAELFTNERTVWCNFLNALHT